jgi:aspartate racemase
VRRYRERWGDEHYPEIVIYSLDFERFTAFENTDRTKYVAEIEHGLTALERSGADLALMAANSPHSVYDDVADALAIPLLSIVEATCAEAKSRDLSSVLLLGIEHTMQSDFYQRVFENADIAVQTPSMDHQETVDRIIFEELAHDEFTDAARTRVQEIIAAYDVDGVILGCTELPMLLGRDDVPIPVLDTLGLHVDAALDAAVADHP